MVTPLIEIATDLAVQHPTLTIEEITNCIVDTIESNTFFMDTIRDLELPSKLDTQLAKFKVNRTRKKNRPKLQEQIDLANLFERTQLKYTIPVECSSTTPIVELNGAQSYYAISTKYPNTSRLINFELKSTNSSKLSVTPISQKDYVDYVTPLHNVSLTHIDIEADTPVLKVLDDINKNIKKGQNLSLYDIYGIISILKLDEKNDVINNIIYEILKKDILFRNEEYSIDCINEIHQRDNYLDENLGIPLPSRDNILELIYESFKAIILQEYERLHEELGQEFINKDTTYDNYLRLTERYTTYADKLIEALR